MSSINTRYIFCSIWINLSDFEKTATTITICISCAHHRKRCPTFR